MNHWQLNTFSEYKFFFLSLKKGFVLFSILLMFFEGRSQDVQVIQINKLENLLNSPGDTTYVLNFWASWCGPCIKELPIFEQVSNEYAGRKVSVVFINLDKLDILETKVKPILTKNSIKSRVLLLNEPDANTWIDKVSPEWEGSLPYTIILNNKKNKRVNIENAVTKEELEKEIQPFLN